MVFVTDFSRLLKVTHAVMSTVSSFKKLIVPSAEIFATVSSLDLNLTLEMFFESVTRPSLRIAEP